MSRQRVKDRLQGRKPKRTKAAPPLAPSLSPSSSSSYQSVPSVNSPGKSQSQFLSATPGLRHNIALHASPTPKSFAIPISVLPVHPVPALALTT